MEADEGFAEQTDSIADVLEVAFKMEMLITEILTLKWSAEHLISLKRWVMINQCLDMENV